MHREQRANSKRVLPILPANPRRISVETKRTEALQSARSRRGRKLRPKTLEPAEKVAAFGRGDLGIGHLFLLKRRRFPVLVA